jgi:hypothetical protein
MTSFYLNFLFKGLMSKYSHSLRNWSKRLLCTDSGSKTHEDAKSIQPEESEGPGSNAASR